MKLTNMKKIFLLVSVLLIINSPMHSQNWSWATRYVSAGDVKANCILNDAFGNVYMTGQVQDSVIIGNDTLIGGVGNFCYFLAKFAADGSPIWAKSTVSNNGLQYGNSIALDPSGNIIVSGNLTLSANFGISNCTGLPVSLNGVTTSTN